MLILKKNNIDEIRAFKFILDKTKDLNEFVNCLKIYTNIRFTGVFKNKKYTIKDFADFIKYFSTELDRGPKIKMYGNNIIKANFYNDTFAPLSEYLPNVSIFANVILDVIYSKMFKNENSLNIVREGTPLWQGGDCDSVLMHIKL